MNPGSKWRWQTPHARLAKGSGSTIIISLDAVRCEAGDRWEKTRETICARLEGLFRERLGPSDFFVPIDETLYLVVTPSATPEEGLICCLRITYDLHTSLLGSCSMEHLDISRAECVGDDVLECTAFSRFEILQMAEKAELVLAPPGSGNLDTQPSDLRPVQAAPVPPTDAEVQFLPVWDAQFQVIRAYRCVYRRISVAGTGMTLQEEARELSHVALMALSRVSDVLQSHLAQNERFIVNLPVSYSVLTAPLARMEFIAACRRLPCELRPYLVFKIEGSPRGVPRSRMIDLITTIGPFCRGVIAKIPGGERSFDSYRGVGLTALGVGLRAASFSQATVAIEHLSVVAKREGLSAFADDVPDKPTLLYALNAGVKWICGARILPAVLEPGPLIRLTLDTLINEAVA